MRKLRLFRQCPKFDFLVKVKMGCPFLSDDRCFPPYKKRTFITVNGQDVRADVTTSQRSGPRGQVWLYMYCCTMFHVHGTYSEECVAGDDPITPNLYAREVATNNTSCCVIHRATNT